MTQRWREHALSTVGEDYAEVYAERFEAAAAEGRAMHGEADFVHALAFERGLHTVLDAGCGTGRVGFRLHKLGHQVTGVDADAAMVAVARRRCPGPRWEVADLAELSLRTRFDVVVLAGNVVPFLAPASLPTVAARMAAHVSPGGLVVTGFGLDADHLPDGVPVVRWTSYERACRAVGLRLVSRHAGWDGSDPDEAAGYVVSVHALAGSGREGTDRGVQPVLGA